MAIAPTPMAIAFSPPDADVVKAGVVNELTAMYWVTGTASVNAAAPRVSVFERAAPDSGGWETVVSVSTSHWTGAFMIGLGDSSAALAGEATTSTPNRLV